MTGVSERSQRTCNLKYDGYIEPHIIASVSGINFEGRQTLTTQRKNLLSIYNNHVTCLNQQYHACLLCFLRIRPQFSQKCELTHASNALLFKEYFL
ncbi:hypothetical protein DJ535_14990 [Citrobacter murliniae]|uniref:Uncharacterized protein n=1 Tax=Citrobacter murliniae TaxID=67829 RepID=A0ABY2PU86_9ENTR|nr:hypothetical protein DJ535_14990 [Citrobacter murliniae]